MIVGSFLKSPAVVLSADRLLWPFTVEYCSHKKIRDVLKQRKTIDSINRTKDAIHFLQSIGCLVHVASTCSNYKQFDSLIDNWYGDISFESIVLNGNSRYKLRHMETIFPEKESSFCLFDSDTKTISKITSLYPNSIGYHSSKFEEVLYTKDLFNS